MTLAPLLLLLAAPAPAWELERGAAVAERGAELVKRWRPYSKTMVDLDIVKKAVQDEEPDWVTRDKEKVTPPERPFGRIHGFTLRERTVRYLVVGRHGPFAPDGRGERSPLHAMRQAELAASAALFQAVVEGPDEDKGWELVSSAAGRDARVQRASDGQPPIEVTWHYLDFYREQGKDAEFFVLIYADKPRPDLAPAPEPGAKAETGIRFMKGR